MSTVTHPRLIVGLIIAGHKRRLLLDCGHHIARWDWPRWHDTDCRPCRVCRRLSKSQPGNKS